MSTTMTCDICKETKSTDDFPVKRASARYKSGGDRCRPCNAERARLWRKQNPGYRGTGKIVSIPKEDRVLVSAISSRLTDAKMRAKKRDMAVDVDREYLYELFKAQDRKCALTGVNLKIEKKAFACLSLDQVDPSLGYTKGNVQWVAWAANRAKGDMPMDMFVDMCSKIVEYQKVQRLSKGAA